MDLAHRRLTLDFTVLCPIGGSINGVRCDICVYHFWFVLFAWGIPPLQSDWSLSCDRKHDFERYFETTKNNKKQQTQQQQHVHGGILPVTPVG